MSIETYFAKIGQELGQDAKAAFSNLFSAVLVDDIGKMAVDAVNYAGTFADQSGDQKRETAKTALLNAAEAAGKDLVNAGEAFLNFMIEAALQAVIAGAVAEATTA